MVGTGVPRQRQDSIPARPAERLGPLSSAPLQTPI